MKVMKTILPNNQGSRASIGCPLSPNEVSSTGNGLQLMGPIGIPKHSGCCQDYRKFSTKRWQDPFAEDNHTQLIELGEVELVWYGLVLCMLPKEKSKHQPS